MGFRRHCNLRRKIAGTPATRIQKTIKTVSAAMNLVFWRVASNTQKARHFLLTPQKNHCRLSAMIFLSALLPMIRL
jgi:hypothetical protein